MSTTENLSTKVVKSIRSEDQPIGKIEPSAPFVMVGLSYMLVLFAVMVVAAILYAIVM